MLPKIPEWLYGVIELIRNIFTTILEYFKKQ